MADNRNYSWNTSNILLRPEYPIIVDWVRNRSRVIDLGCGNGSLVRVLKEHKEVVEAGIEISSSGVDICQQVGLSNIVLGRIDSPLTSYADNQFDYAICNVTLQMVEKPEVLLQEMKRISKYQIISFPNFAFVLQRFDLLFNGRMPRRLLYGYDWYSTGHIHQFSISDFRKTVDEMGLQVVDSSFMVGKRIFTKMFMPNLLATAGIFLLEKQNN